MSVATNRSQRARWKQAEREIAEKLGGKRVPVTGRTLGSAPDIDHADFGLEVKTRESLPKWLRHAFDQAKACSRLAGKVPMVVLHEVGERYDQAYVIVQLQDVEHLNLPVRRTDA